MPKRKAKDVVKITEEEEEEEDNKGIQREEKKGDEEEEGTNIFEAEREIAAIKAIRDVKIKQSLTALRLMCSSFAEEQLEKPVLDFFKENLPDLSIEVDDNGEEIEFKCNHNNNGDSFLGGYHLPHHGTHNPHLQNHVFQGTSENRMLASLDALQTSEINGGQRLPFGMTPKSRRQPKPGEMMLSVHGTPLGVYEKYVNMGAINEENS